MFRHLVFAYDGGRLRTVMESSEARGAFREFHMLARLGYAVAWLQFRTEEEMRAFGNQLPHQRNP